MFFFCIDYDIIIVVMMQMEKSLMFACVVSATCDEGVYITLYLHINVSKTICYCLGIITMLPKVYDLSVYLLIKLGLYPSNCLPTHSSHLSSKHPFIILDNTLSLHAAKTIHQIHMIISLSIHRSLPH